MSARIYTDDMGEISGFGGSYEAACRAMVLAGLAWFDAHPEGEPQFKGYQNIYGVITEENADAKALSAAVVEASGGDCTGAMHQAAISHIFAVRKLGWDEYAKQMKERKS